MQAVNSRNVQSIQIMRGIAALLVVFLHISIKGGQYGNGAMRGFSVGGSGVDLFFIISGYIMCYSTAGRSMSSFEFLAHRCKRILPLYWITTCLGLVIFLYNPRLVNTSGGETSIWASFLLFPNGKRFLNSNGWTLSYEFLYYLIFAIFIGRGTDKAIRWSSVILLALVAAGLVIHPANVYLVFSTNILYLEFVFGMACFYWLRQGVNVGYGISLCLLGALILIFEQVWRAPDQEIWRGFYWGVPMLFIFIGFLSMEPMLQKSGSFFKSVLLGIGDSSYSLYLMHPFVLSGSAMLLKRLGMASNPWLFTLILLVSAVVIGHLVYLYIERPITRLLKRSPGK